jgi:hypothetical protein
LIDLPAVVEGEASFPTGARVLVMDVTNGEARVIPL